VEPTSLVDKISALMEAHSVPFHIEDDWVVPLNKLPAIRANWYPRDGSGRLDVEILLNDNRVIYECFAGIGSGTDGVADALQNFCVNSFHVLLACFWEAIDKNQVEIGRWNVKGKPFTAYIGNFGTRGSAGIEAKIPQNLYPELERTIKSESLDESIHWFRVFFCEVAGEFTFEALKDNESWENGENTLQSLNWEKQNGYYSVRNFIVLVPDRTLEVAPIGPCCTTHTSGLRKLYHKLAAVLGSQARR
jgi:hypothetical protein